MRPRGVHTALWLACLLALGTPAVRAEPAAVGGIANDVEIAHLLDEIEAQTARQSHVTEELSQLDERKAQANKALRMRVRALYRITRAGMAPVAGGFDAVRKHVARARRLSSLIRNDAGQLQALGTRSVTLHAEASLGSSALGRAREQLAALQQQKAAPPALGGGGDGFGQVLADTGSAPRSNASSGAFYGLRLADDAPAQDGFEALRGRLASPVSGETRVHDARREESDGPGLEFEAPSGTPVRAAAAGRVAFCDRYGSYGRLVIVDHGNGYYTAYGGLGVIEVRVGDDLSAQARIGSIGSESARPALFFEVRKGTRTLSPRVWLGL